VIELEHIADFVAAVAPPIEIGTRRLIPITGGEVLGPKLRGRILPGGADFQLVRADDVAELHARYAIETTDGAMIYVENSGLRYGPPEAMEKIRRGEPVDPALIYCRTTPRFETAAPQYQWLTRHLFVATAVRRPDRVELAIYQIL
jgi:Protein of unknown function (DUF3237)